MGDYLAEQRMIEQGEQIIQDKEMDRLRREWVISECETILGRKPTKREVAIFGKRAWNVGFRAGVKFAKDK